MTDPIEPEDTTNAGEPVSVWDEDENPETLVGEALPPEEGVEDTELQLGIGYWENSEREES